MSQFDESKHNRHSDGKFANKPHAEADGVTLTPDNGSQETATITRTISYPHYAYPTPRARKLRLAHTTETVNIPVPVIPAEDAPLAAGDYRLHGSTYYKPAQPHHGLAAPDGTHYNDVPQSTLPDAPTSEADLAQLREEAMQKAVGSQVMIDGELYVAAGEPHIKVQRWLGNAEVLVEEQSEPQERPTHETYRLDQLDEVIAANPGIGFNHFPHVDSVPVHDPAQLGVNVKALPNIDTMHTVFESKFRGEPVKARYERVMGQVRDAGLVSSEGAIDWNGMSEKQEDHVKRTIRAFEMGEDMEY